MAKTWFITGTSRGFGRAWAIAALERGDNVAATARNTDSLADLVERFGDAILPLTLDVTDREAAFAAIAQANKHFGTLDVVVNNAGYGHFGYVEELSEADARNQMETNFFGLLWVTQAAIPVMRAQGGGHIIQVSSVAGVTAGPSLGMYSASKWAVEGISESLAAEVAGFGIRTTIVEPGAFATDWGGSSAVASTQMAEYQPARDATAEMMKNYDFSPVPTDASVKAILTIVDAEKPPLRLPLSSLAYDSTRSTWENNLAAWAATEELARSADAA